MSLLKEKGYNNHNLQRYGEDSEEIRTGGDSEQREKLLVRLTFL